MTAILATIGGDAHNFQCYSPGKSSQRGEEADGPQLHLVAGCGGAFMHGTHNYLSAEHDSRIRHSPKHQFYKQPDWSFPTPADFYRGVPAGGGRARYELERRRIAAFQRRGGIKRSR